MTPSKKKKQKKNMTPKHKTPKRDYRQNIL